MKDLALVEVLPRQDEITDYTIRDGKIIDLSENPLPVDQLVVVRQWTGMNNPTTLRYTGERNSPRLRRARVLSTGKDCTDIKAGDTILVGIFCGLEADFGDGKDIRWIKEREVQLLVEND
jgi:hypothetical protein